MNGHAHHHHRNERGSVLYRPNFPSRGKLLELEMIKLNMSE